MEITAVLFDMGGTLLSYENRQQMGSAFVTALRRLGLDPADPAVVEARHRAGQEVEREYAARRSFIHRDLFRDRVSRTAALMGVGVPAEVLDRFDDEQRAAVVEHLAPMPGVHETLRLLRERRIYVAVVSNADDDYLEPALARHGLTPLLDHWTSSEEADSCKPDERIYEYSLAKARRSAAEALFVGDSPAHDVAGARRVGMRSVLIGEPGSVAPLSSGLRADEPDWQVRELLELIPIVDAANHRRATR